MGIRERFPKTSRKGCTTAIALRRVWSGSFDVVVRRFGVTMFPLGPEGRFCEQFDPKCDICSSCKAFPYISEWGELFIRFSWIVESGRNTHTKVFTWISRDRFRWCKTECIFWTCVYRYLDLRFLQWDCVKLLHGFVGSSFVTFTVSYRKIY